MAMQYDVKAKTTDSSGALVASRIRLKGLLVSIASAGTDPVEFFDNPTTATGTAVFSVITTVAGSTSILIPGEGVLFENGISVDVGDADSVTIFYG